MPATRTQARDELFALITAALQPTYSSLKVIWPDTKDQTPNIDPPGSYLKVFLQHTTGNQDSLLGSELKRRYLNTGILTVQLFTPTGNGSTLADTISSTIVNGLRSKRTTNGVITRSVVAQEIGSDGNHTQTNIIATFEYDEIV